MAADYEYDSQASWAEGDFKNCHAVDPAGKLTTGVSPSTLAEKDNLGVYLRCYAGSGTVIYNSGTGGNGILIGGEWKTRSDGRHYISKGTVTIPYSSAMKVPAGNCEYGEGSTYDWTVQIRVKLDSIAASIFMQRDKRFQIGIDADGIPYVKNYYSVGWIYDERVTIADPVHGSPNVIPFLGQKGLILGTERVWIAKPGPYMEAGGYEPGFELTYYPDTNPNEEQYYLLATEWYPGFAPYAYPWLDNTLIFFGPFTNGTEFLIKYRRQMFANMDDQEGWVEVKGDVEDTLQAGKWYLLTAVCNNGAIRLSIDDSLIAKFDGYYDIDIWTTWYSTRVGKTPCVSPDPETDLIIGYATGSWEEALYSGEAALVLNYPISGEWSEVYDLGIEKTKRPYIKFDLNLPLKQLKGYDEDTFKFDCIFCLEVFEYIWNPIEAMSNISKLLGYDGKAIISFPTQYPLHQPKLFDSLRYMKHGIIQLVKHSNLKIKKMFPRKATKGAKALNSFFALEGMHPVKGDNSIYDIGYILEVYKPFQ